MSCTLGHANYIVVWPMVTMNRNRKGQLLISASNTCSPQGVLNNFLVFHSITHSLISPAFACPPTPDILLASFYLLIKTGPGGTFSGMPSPTILSKAGLGIQFHALHHQGWQTLPYHLGCSIVVFLSFLSLCPCAGIHLAIPNSSVLFKQHLMAAQPPTHIHVCMYSICCVCTCMHK